MKCFMILLFDNDYIFLRTYTQIEGKVEATREREGVSKRSPALRIIENTICWSEILHIVHGSTW